MTQLIDENARGVELLQYLAYTDDKFVKLLEEPELIKTPIVRKRQTGNRWLCPGCLEDLGSEKLLPTISSILRENKNAITNR